MTNCNENKLLILGTSDGSNQQTMGYILVYNHYFIVVDGGAPNEYNYLKKLLLEVGGEIDYLIITHAHLDHFAALTPLINNKDIIIKNIVYNFATKEDTYTHTPKHEWHYFDEFIDALKNSGINEITCKKDYVISLDGISIRFLNDRYQLVTDMNQSSMCFKVYLDNNESILFLGDLDPTNSLKFYKENKDSGVLKSTYCQLAHHGQSGGCYELYKEIAPKYALWSTTKLNYDNDWGNSFNTGPLTSLETRKWMDELGAKNILAFEELKPIILKK